MQMRLGETLRVTLLGSSHGPFVGATIEGMPAGIQVNEERIQRAMSLRKTGGTYSSKRKEDDLVEWKKGVINGLTTGEVIELQIANNDARSSDYSFLPDHPRPGHQDMVMLKRTDGEADLRGGGTSSARMTAPLVAISAVLAPWLERYNIDIESHLGAIGHVEARPMNTCPLGGPTQRAKPYAAETQKQPPPWRTWLKRPEKTEIPSVRGLMCAFAACRSVLANRGSMVSSLPWPEP